MGFTPRDFRDCLGLFATGVAVATCLDSRGEPIGLTINSFSSVSLEPPLVLWCLDRASATYGAFTSADIFAVNILAEGCHETARHFSDPCREAPDPGTIRPGRSGAPLLDEAMAHLECALHAIHDGGDHVILVGRVLAIETAPKRPLVYFRGTFDRLG